MNADVPGQRGRIAYTSRSLRQSKGWVEEAIEISKASRVFNEANGIDGLLLATNGFFLQVLEGDLNTVEALFERIAKDPRHTDVERLTEPPGSTRSCKFKGWSCAWLQRHESIEITADRLAYLKNILSCDPNLQVDDFFRLMATPGAGERNREHQKTGHHTIAISSPNNLWETALLHHLAIDRDVAEHRSRLSVLGAESSQAVIEYVDFVDPTHGPVRVIAPGGDTTDTTVLAPLLSPVDLVAVLMSPSELPKSAGQFGHWAETLRTCAPNAEWMLLTSADARRREPARQALDAFTGRSSQCEAAKLNATAELWASILRGLGQALEAERRLKAAQDAEGLDACNEALGRLTGCVASAVLSLTPAAVLRCQPDQAHDQAAADIGWLRTQVDLLHRLAIDSDCGSLEDVTVVSGTHVHVFRPLKAKPNTVLSACFDRSSAMLAAARLQLQDIEQEFSARL